MPLFADWLEGEEDTGSAPLLILTERDGSRPHCLPQLADAVVDNLFGLDILNKLGYASAASALRETLPTRARSRSGDVGEILATEYVIEQTEFDVPIKRLRYKDGRDNAVRGEDLIAIKVDEDGHLELLKGEAKSAQRLSASTVDEAIEQLQENSARPSAFWLSFLGRRLIREDRAEEGILLFEIQKVGVADRDLKHLLFTFTGNDPARLFEPHRESSIERNFVGVVIPDHQDLINNIFDRIHADLN